MGQARQMLQPMDPGCEEDSTVRSPAAPPGFTGQRGKKYSDLWAVKENGHSGCSTEGQRNKDEAIGWRHGWHDEHPSWHTSKAVGKCWCMGLMGKREQSCSQQ